jgi:hypothetical protein
MTPAFCVSFHTRLFYSLLGFWSQELELSLDLDSILVSSVYPHFFLDPSQAFGTQKKLGDIYQRIVHQALVVDRKIALINGAGFGVFFFVIYGAYALGTLCWRLWTLTKATKFMGLILQSSI